MFGHAVKVYYKDVLDKYKDVLDELGFNPNNGLADLYKRIKKLPKEQRKAIEADIQKVYEKQADLAMVDSDKGITNLHVPNNVIIDASMPVVVATGTYVGMFKANCRILRLYSRSYICRYL